MEPSLKTRSKVCHRLYHSPTHRAIFWPEALWERGQLTTWISGDLCRSQSKSATRRAKPKSTRSVRSQETRAGQQRHATGPLNSGLHASLSKPRHKALSDLLMSPFLGTGGELLIGSKALILQLREQGCSRTHGQQESLCLLAQAKANKALLDARGSGKSRMKADWTTAPPCNSCPACTRFQV